MTDTTLFTRFGRTDYDLGVLESESDNSLGIQDFNQKFATNAKSVPGSLTIGQAEIECRCRWSECQWGVLSRHIPAGIVYMDISFKQPHGYWLENARVIITLSESTSSYYLAKSRKHQKLKIKNQQRNLDSHVQMHCFGPCDLAGTENVETQNVTTNAGVNISGPSMVGANAGREYSTSKSKTTRWRFSGDITSPEDGQTFRTLVWELAGDKVSRERPNLPRFNTAFAFKHRRNRVYMRVEVEGQLGSKIRQAFHSGLKFSSKYGSRDYSTLTELNLGGTHGFTTALDEIAKNLKSTMMSRNLERIPTEVPRSKPAPDAATESQNCQIFAHDQNDTPSNLSNDNRQNVDPTLLELEKHCHGLLGTGVIAEYETSKSQRGESNENIKLDIAENGQVVAQVDSSRDTISLTGMGFMWFIIMIWGFICKKINRGLNQAVDLGTPL